MKKLNFKGVKFLVKKKNMQKWKNKIIFSINVFGYDETPYSICTPKKKNLENMLIYYCYQIPKILIIFQLIILIDL